MTDHQPADILDRNRKGAAMTMQVVLWQHYNVNGEFLGLSEEHPSSRRRVLPPDVIVGLVREADALAAIKAALDLGIELTWQKMIMEIAGDTIDDMDSPLSAKVRELTAQADAIRLLGEDAGRGES